MLFPENVLLNIVNSEIASLIVQAERAWLSKPARHSFEILYDTALNKITQDNLQQRALQEVFSSKGFADRVKAFQDSGHIIEPAELATLQNTIEPEQAQQLISQFFQQLQNELAQHPELNAELFRRLPTVFLNVQKLQKGYKNELLGLAIAYANVAAIYLYSGDVLTAVRYLVETQLVFLNSGAIEEYHHVSEMLATIEEQLSPEEFRDLVQRAFEPTRENGIVWGEYTILTASEVAKLLHRIQESR